MSDTSSRLMGTHDRFQVRWVFGNLGEVLRQQLVAFWLKEGALSHAAEAWRRAFEAACVLTDGESGDIAGVCTVSIRLDDHERCYGFVRIFISVDSRFVGLNVRLMECMIEGFSALASEPGAPQRLVATIENPKIRRRGAQRILSRLGFVPTGTAPNGEMVIERKL